MCVRKGVATEAVQVDSGAALVDQLVVLSEARPHERIVVTGHKTLDVFLGLCRRGFLNAMCRTPAESPHTSDNLADSLWVVDPENAAELRTIITRCCRDLRKGGNLLVSWESHVGTDAILVLGAVLIRCGFTPIRRLVSTTRTLLLCENQRPSDALAA